MADDEITDDTIAADIAGIERRPLTSTNDHLLLYAQSLQAARQRIVELEQWYPRQQLDLIHERNDLRRQLSEARARRSETVAMCRQLQVELSEAQAQIAALTALLRRIPKNPDADQDFMKEWVRLVLDANPATAARRVERATPRPGGALMDRIERAIANGELASLKNRFGIPTVVCLCGSTRFYSEFQRMNYELTIAGKIVLSVGFYPHSQEEMHGGDVGCTAAQKVKLDELHKRKIDFADEVFVLNVGGYVGDSTRSEISYAESTGKLVRWLEGA